MWKDMKKSAKIILISGAVTCTFLGKVGFISEIKGNSMQPVFNPAGSSLGKNDFVFVNRLACRDYNFRRGEIVSLKSPTDPKVSLIKRVVALEGDVVKSRKSAILHRIPEHYCWVEGDNPSNSLDSNAFGPVPLTLLYGKARYIVSPIRRWRKLDSSALESDRIKINNEFQET